MLERTTAGMTVAHVNCMPGGKGQEGPRARQGLVDVNGWASSMQCDETCMWKGHDVTVMGKDAENND